MNLNEILHSGDETYPYRLLGRLKSDCEYYLGYGNRCAKYLWAGDEKKQLSYMKAIWESFSADKKPEWLSYEQILEYEKELLGERSPLIEQVTSAAVRASEQLSAEKGPVCKITFLQTHGASELPVFDVYLNILPQNYTGEKDGFLLNTDERMQAYDKAAEIVGEERLSDYVIKSAEMTAEITAEKRIESER